MKSLKSAFVLPTFTLSMMACGIIANSSFAQPDSAADGYAGATTDEEPVAPVAEGGGCSDGGGSSSISLFSALILGLLIILSSRFRKPILARIRL